MLDTNVALPSQPRAILEEGNAGTYEIDGLYPGYGHTLGNSLRRIILSSLPGAAITHVKVQGAEHEFSVLDGVREDVLTILLNVKRIRFKMHDTTEPVTVTLSVKGPGVVSAEHIDCPATIEVLNPDQYIAEITGKTELTIEMTVSHGLGYVARDVHEKERMTVGMIALDAVFTPIRRVNYDVEQMRVGDRTDYNRLRISLETDGTMTPREALEASIATMIHQLKAIIGFQDEVEEAPEAAEEEAVVAEEPDADTLKTRIETLDLTARTMRSLEAASIRTVGGLVRKTREDILALEGIGDKGLDEIEDVLNSLNVSLKA
ncbi:DNA-directed RNA polymerase subunit alpha [Candidatus Kaiserbacteria bacterium RIFCSPHIGHO2_02_FULL_49_34]|uniref:DNA-directed RNA polymerase subunit alpha n=1 Tax=Candidatus Kaiserbacteria bacterium RIFCSPHIGHO2_02_FULL_49_34 TaxID=1798491 RepID=A0A1F6DI13_9BACT|nr:MAG: DNA-directed RNA polymerase subunit alpha [Candidatus Kaiserbacteria bacterium RIFCSPHIGHO2_02_FULL_49_34]